ncbi:MAG: hypothetical protein GWN62_16940 [Aliifodinibius sp.]|nr:hypothetical protein [Fodinibius sp.]
MNHLIIIDPGHGGIDPNTGQYVTKGKRSPEWDDMPQLFEGVYNREIADLLGAKLDKVGIDYKYTVCPDEYYDMPLRNRTDIANAIHRETPVTLFLSIHGNGFKNPDANGLETFCHARPSANSVRYNEIIYKHLKKMLPYKGRGTKQADFHVLRETVMPAVLVELGFMTNYDDCKIMNSPGGKELAAEGLFRAIKEICLID